MRNRAPRTPLPPAIVAENTPLLPGTDTQDADDKILLNLLVNTLD